MVQGSQYQSARRNPVGIAIVIGLHALFALALLNALRLRQARPAADRITASFLPSTHSDPVPPVLPVDPMRRIRITDPQLQPPRFAEEAPTDIVVENPPPTDGASSGAADSTPQPRLIQVGIDPRWPLTQPPYPSAAIRAGNEGNLALEVLVGTNGRVRDARILRSSGFPALDQAAIDEARHRWRLRPATRDGVAFEQWYTLKVIFHLENR